MATDEKIECVGEYRCINDLKISSRMNVNVVRDKDGLLFIAYHLNREKLLAHYRIVFHDRDEEMSLEDVDKMALQRYEQASKDFRAMYERTKDLSHPHIAEIIKLIHDDAQNIDVLITEYVSGQPLFDIAVQLSPMQMISIFVRIFTALDYQHENGLLNLNLKSSSFRINLESEDPVVKLMNYGFAIPKGKYSGAIRGPDLCMAPEVAFGRTDAIDERADLYSMATLMYYCVTGNYPYPSRRSANRDLNKLKTRIAKEEKPADLNSFRDDVPDGLQHLIFTLLEKDPDQRKEFETATTVVNYFYNKWPDASREMAVEHTITTSEGKSGNTEDDMNE